MGMMQPSLLGLKHITRTLIAPAHPNKKTAGDRRSFRLQLGLMRSTCSSLRQWPLWDEQNQWRQSDSGHASESRHVNGIHRVTGGNASCRATYVRLALQFADNVHPRVYCAL